jgi:hypothetical protein
LISAESGLARVSMVVLPVGPKATVVIPFWPITGAVALTATSPKPWARMPWKPSEVIAPELVTVTVPVPLFPARIPPDPEPSTKIAALLVTVTPTAFSPKLKAAMPAISSPCPAAPS